MTDRETASRAPEPRHRILLVEDHSAMREAVTELLETDDRLDVLAAVESAEDALDLLGSNRRVDLAVVDLNLPGMHGLELVAELESRSHIPVIVLSSHPSDRYGPAARNAGARAYVEKIRTASELLETVHKVLDEAGGHPGARARADGDPVAVGRARSDPDSDVDPRRPLDDALDGPIRPT